MNKILNKLFYIAKNILLPITLALTIYIIIFMFKRLEKEIFGSSFLEFLGIVFPYFLILILTVINSFLEHKNVKNNLFYNLTSFLVMFVILIFCYRAMFDKSMYMWHKYNYNINFNYFADQVAPIKVMLYGLSFANILLIIEHYLEKDKYLEESKEIKEVKVSKKTKKSNLKSE